MKSDVQFNAFKTVCSSFVEEISKLVNYINNNPNCNVLIKKEEYEKYLGSNIIKNNKDQINTSDFLNLLVNYIMRKIQLITKDINSIITTSIIGLNSSKRILYHFNLTQFKAFNDDFFKIIQCLKYCICPKITYVDINTGSKMVSLLSSVISNFYKLKAKVNINEFLGNFKFNIKYNNLIGSKLNDDDRKIFNELQTKLSKIFEYGMHYITYLDKQCDTIEFELSSSVLYKDYQELIFKLDDIQAKLIENDSFGYLQFPYPEPVVTFFQLLRNYALIIARNMQYAYDNLKSLESKYKKKKITSHDDFENLKTEMQKNYSVLLHSIIFIVLLIDDLRMELNDRHPKTSKRIGNLLQNMVKDFIDFLLEKEVTCK